MLGPDRAPSTVCLRSWPLPLKDLIGSDASDAVLVMLPKPLAGLGTSRQVVGLIEGLIAATAVPVHYVGPAADDGPALLREPYEEVPVVSEASETFQVCTEVMTIALRRLVESGRRRPFVISMGYTAFGPESVKRAAAATPGLDQITVCVVDSAFPDTHEPELDLNDDGWPTSRFYSPAFASTPEVTTAFALTSSYAYDPRILDARRPDVAFAGVIAPPYTDAYIKTLADAGVVGRTQGPSGLGLWEELEATEDGDLLVPFVSSDIWSPGAVGAWMTEQEYGTVVRGTGNVIGALELLAGQMGKRVFVPIDESARGTVDGLSPEGVVPLYYEGLEQVDHARLLGAADFAISRTGGQANASVVLTMVGTAVVVIDLPAAGYMQAELTSSAIDTTYAIGADGGVESTPRADALGYVGRWDQGPEELAELFGHVLTDPDRSRRVANARTAFNEIRTRLDSNLLLLVEQLTRPT